MQADDKKETPESPEEQPEASASEDAATETADADAEQEEAAERARADRASAMRAKDNALQELFEAKAQISQLRSSAAAAQDTRELDEALEEKSTRITELEEELKVARQNGAVQKADFLARAGMRQFLRERAERRKALGLPAEDDA